MDNNERIVKGIWFPIEIWEAEDLDWNEKILLLEIDSFTSKGLDCYISNEYIAGLFKVSERKAADMVNDLINKGYVIKTKFDGRRRFIESNIIAKLAGQTCKNQHSRLAKINIADLQKMHTTYNKINNCSTNNQTNNKGGFDFYKALTGLGVTPQTAKDWMAVRKEKRAANTETAFRRIQQEISKAGLTAEECIRMSAEHSWQGFKAEWVQKQTRAAPAQKVVSAYEHNRRLMEELMGAGFNETGGMIDEQ
jgi:hypothetical protein